MLLHRLTNLSHYKIAVAWLKKYERLLMPATLLFGFAVDFATFRTLNITTSLYLLAGHAVFAGAVILFMNVYEARFSAERKVLSYLRLVSPFALQVSFGALLSAAFIFYSFGGVFSVSWPLFAALAALMLSNEIFRSHYARPVVQASIYYFVVFLFFALAFPFAFHSVSPWFFALSSAVSLAAIFGFYYILFRLSEGTARHRGAMHRNTCIIFFAMLVLYFSNIIPPVPLALYDGAVFYALERAGSQYHALAEKQNFFQKIIPGATVHIAPGERIFVYASIFAPADLRTRIVHEWQRYDEARDEWVSVRKLSYSLTGGRKDGFRGYTVRPVSQDGRWRVLVETERGQVMGKIAFRVKFADVSPETVEVVK